MPSPSTFSCSSAAHPKEAAEPQRRSLKPGRIAGTDPTAPSGTLRIKDCRRRCAVAYGCCVGADTSTPTPDNRRPFIDSCATLTHDAVPRAPCVSPLQPLPQAYRPGATFLTFTAGRRAVFVSASVHHRSPFLHQQRASLDTFITLSAQTPSGTSSLPSSIVRNGSPGYFTAFSLSTSSERLTS